MAIAQGEPACGGRCARGQGFFKCAMYGMQNSFERISCSAADVRRFPFLHSDEFCPFFELTCFIIYTSTYNIIK